MRLVRLFRLIIAGLATSGLVVGCASLPQSGQTGESDQQANVDQNVAYTFNPAGPAQDATATSVINGFILAATGIQGDFSTAREFLTDEAAETWDPTAKTTIYTVRLIVDVKEAYQNCVELASARTLDEAGVLQLTDEGATQNFVFRL